MDSGAMNNEAVNNETVKNEAADSGVAKKSGKPKIFLIVAAAVILVAAAAGVGIYNLPANRVARLLELGQKYLAEEQFEEAALAFEQAIAIDRREMEAYTGGMTAYLGSDDMEGAQKFYEQALAVTQELEEDFLAENMESVVELYLFAADVYEDNPEKAAQTLEKGYEQTKERPEILEMLTEEYIGIAKKKTGEAVWQDALAVYDRLLELDASAPGAADGLSDCLNAYIDALMEAQDYETVRALAEKYGAIAADADFVSALARIEEIERIAAENKAFMQKVYDLMAAEDYDGMLGVDGSEEARAFVERMEEDCYVYFPDGAAFGTGAGVYQFGDGGYYFYYGDYADGGERAGNGTIFFEYSGGGGGYYTFAGIWAGDAPNGEGTVSEIGGKSVTSDVSYNKVSQGMLVDGLWDGRVSAILTDVSDGREYDLSFEAENGIPTEDLTQELQQYISIALGENEYIIAYDYNDEADSWWWSYMSRDETKGIVGFED